MRRLRPPAIAIALLLAACAGQRVAEPSPTLAHVPAQTLPDGHVAVLVREYEDAVKLGDGREQRMHVRYLWDYSAGLAREIQTAPDGRLLSDRTLPALTLNATEAELAYAVALLRRDQAIDARFTADSDIYGGFSYREPGHEHCDAGSRCIHVIVSRDGGRYKVAHAIVDLQTARVIDPDYDPELGGVAETPTKAANR
jgi:hypothetical protein